MVPRGRGERLRPAARGLLVAHGLAAVAMAAPWPVLLLAVWNETGSGSWVGIVGASRLAPYVALCPGSRGGSPTGSRAAASSSSRRSPVRSCSASRHSRWRKARSQVRWPVRRSRSQPVRPRSPRSPPPCPGPRATSRRVPPRSSSRSRSAPSSPAGGRLRGPRARSGVARDRGGGPRDLGRRSAPVPVVARPELRHRSDDDDWTNGGRAAPSPRHPGGPFGRSSWSRSSTPS